MKPLLQLLKEAGTLDRYINPKHQPQYTTQYPDTIINNDPNFLEKQYDLLSGMFKHDDVEYLVKNEISHIIKHSSIDGGNIIKYKTFSKGNTLSIYIETKDNESINKLVNSFKEYDWKVVGSRTENSARFDLLAKKEFDMQTLNLMGPKDSLAKENKNK